MPFDATPIPNKARVLIDALELLRTQGWCQEATTDGTGRLCLFGAIRQAGNLRTSWDFDALGIPWPTDFNDAPGRTFAEVEQWMLDRIADAIRQ